VIELDTGLEHGPFDSEADMALQRVILGETARQL